jgi:predicted HNH restriction endonuclease
MWCDPVSSERTKTEVWGKQSMATWIFQANPDVFDIDGYLAESTGDFRFLVTRYKNDLAIGDTVYIWRSIGRQGDSDKAGIVAEAIIVGPVEHVPDDPESLPFWKNQAGATQPEDRVMLRLVRLANKKEVLKREWLKDDSVLSQLTILKLASGTNFAMDDKQATRLAQLWVNTGKDWSEREIIAALKLYSEVWDQPIGRNVGSPVEQLAQLISRAPTGVYNKLMNFRALDSRSTAAGFTATSKSDVVVWDRYFDPNTKTIDKTKLAADVERLWGETPAVEPLVEPEKVAAEVRRLSEKSLDALMSTYKKASKLPTKRKKVSVSTYSRSPLVAAITLKRADWKCEVSACTSPVLEGNDGVPLMEVHHLHRLADGGADEIGNTVCVCPNHHRALHYGKAASKLRQGLEALRATATH